MAKTKSKRKPKTTKPRVDHYQVIADRIIASMKSTGLAPWRCSWSTSARGSMLPRNGITGKAYRGINVWLTVAAQLEAGYDLPIWVTFKQAGELAAKAARASGRKVVKSDGRGKPWVFAAGEDQGRICGGIRKGEKSIEVYFWKRITTEAKDDEEDPRSFLLMKSYRVFNVAQCDQAVIDYITRQETEAMAAVDFDPIARAEAICAGYDCDVQHRGIKAYYSIMTDRINLPARKRFKTPAEYYSTRFHEMGHSTGAEHRLNRDGISTFDFRGSHQYADEELVAEFTSCFLCADAGILRETEGNSAAYLNHWAARIKHDPKIIVHAAQRAQRAADCIQGTEFAAAASDSQSGASERSAAQAA